MDATDELLTCEQCQTTTPDCEWLDSPEHCECCDEVLCWSCWAAGHMAVFR